MRFLFLAPLLFCGCGVLTPATQAQATDAANHVVDLGITALDDYLSDVIANYVKKNPGTDAADCLAALGTCSAAVKQAVPQKATRDLVAPKKPSPEAVAKLRAALAGR